MDNSDIVYNGNVVNSTTGELEKESELFSPIITSVEHATSQIMSAKGFQEYIGGLSYDTFSGMILECQNVVKAFITNIRQAQVQILSYSQDDNEIQAFLNSLDNSLSIRLLVKVIAFLTLLLPFRHNNNIGK